MSIKEKTKNKTSKRTHELLLVLRRPPQNLKTLNFTLQTFNLIKSTSLCQFFVLNPKKRYAIVKHSLCGINKY
jgi:hypothetical protein